MRVEIWSDLVCPWCYIGKRRFERALERFPGGERVEVVWRSFELDPDAPPDHDVKVAEVLAEKYRLSPAEARDMIARMEAEAAKEGLDYHLAEAKRSNTFDAHRLTHLAAERGVQGALTERLMSAYFTEGEAIGEHETLARLAAEVGLAGDEALAVLGGDAHGEAVRADERRAAQLGIRGVPFFVFDGRYGVSGAQPAEMHLSVLERAWNEASPLTMVSGSEGRVDVCEDECAF
jgi:predicted DsbA family dithiol-disulfide isomerase